MDHTGALLPSSIPDTKAKPQTLVGKGQPKGADLMDDANDDEAISDATLDLAVVVSS